MIKRLSLVIAVGMVAILSACAGDPAISATTFSPSPEVMESALPEPSLTPEPSVIPDGEGFNLVARTLADEVDVYDAPGGAITQTLIREEVVFNASDPENAMAFRVIDHSLADTSGWVEVMTPVYQLHGWIQLDENFKLAWRDRSIVIDLSERTLCVFAYEQVDPVKCVPVSVGAPDTPTTAGDFYVTERLALSYVDDVYGPYQVLTNIDSPYAEEEFEGGIAIHGTADLQNCVRDQKACSHGCVRMFNADVTWLVTTVEEGGAGIKSGSPILIEE